MCILFLNSGKILSFLTDHLIIVLTRDRRPNCIPKSVDCYWKFQLNISIEEDLMGDDTRFLTIQRIFVATTWAGLRQKQLHYVSYQPRPLLWPQLPFAICKFDDICWWTLMNWLLCQHPELDTTRTTQDQYVENVEDILSSLYQMLKGFKHFVPAFLLL